MNPILGLPIYQRQIFVIPETVKGVNGGIITVEHKNI
jgi:hypothetical protein